MRDKKESTVRELIRSSEGVLDNPFLRAVVEVAPSPTAADKYMCDLGWPNDLARAVRDAVRLRQMCEGVKQLPKERDSNVLWSLLAQTNVRPAEAMFAFGAPGLPPSPATACWISSLSP